MRAGAQELEQWLMDLVRQGLASLDHQHEEYLEELASRMVNAKLSGIANRIRALKPLFTQVNWHEKVLEEVTFLYLFSKSFQNLSSQNEGLQQELLRLGGVRVDKKQMLEQDGIRDKWLVLGLQFGGDEKLNFRRTWLYGEQSRRLALILDYLWGSEDFQPIYQFGHIYKGAAIYYPGAVKVRALFKEPVTDQAGFQGQGGFPHFDSFMKTYTKVLRKNPFLEELPCLFNDVIPHFQDNCYLIDKLNKSIPIDAASPSFWKIMGLSMGQPISLFGLWNGKHFNPISTFANNRLIALEK